MIISVDTEKVFHKIQNTSQNTRNREKFPNMIKGIYEKHTKVTL